MTALTKLDLATVTGGQVLGALYEGLNNRFNPSCDVAQRRLARLKADGEHGLHIPVFSTLTQIGAESIAQGVVNRACRQ